jgi:hypothetical protein
MADDPVIWQDLGWNPAMSVGFRRIPALFVEFWH